jgi:hypothetical protein
VAGYDPQRTRHRPRPDNGSAAPVDSILDGPVEPEPVDASSLVDEAAAADEVLDQPSVTPPAERPTPSAIDLTTVPPPPARPSPARLVVGGGLLALLLALLWWRLRSRRTAED